MRYASLASIAVIVVACSGSDESNGDASDSFLDAYCAELNPCCLGEEGAGTGCKAIHQFGASGASYDSARADECLAEIRAKKTDPTFCQKVSLLAPSCKSVWVRPAGTAAPGGECSRDSDCASPAGGEVKCTPNAASSPAFICQVSKGGKAGDSPCIGTKKGPITAPADSSQTLPEGFVCDVADGLYCAKSGACETQAATGAPCDTSEQCADGGLCSFGSKTCEARKNEGEPCASFGECKSDLCTDGKCAATASFDSLLFLACAKQGS